MYILLSIMFPNIIIYVLPPATETTFHNWNKNLSRGKVFLRSLKKKRNLVPEIMWTFIYITAVGEIERQTVIGSGIIRVCVCVWVNYGKFYFTVKLRLQKDLM
jgi:hypothetical protein